MKDLRPKCGMTNAQYNVILDNIDALQKDLALLQTEVDSFNTTVESVNGNFTNLTTDQLTAETENIKTSQIDHLSLRELSKEFTGQTVPVNESKYILRQKGSGSFEVKVRSGEHEADIVVDSVNEVFITKCFVKTGLSPVDHLNFYKSGDDLFVAVSFSEAAVDTATIEVNSFSNDSEVFPAISTDLTLSFSVPVNKNQIIFHGDLAYEGQTVATFENVSITSATITDYLHFGRNTVMRCHEGEFEALKYNKLLLLDGAVSLKGGDVVLRFDSNGELESANVRNGGNVFVDSNKKVYYVEDNAVEPAIVSIDWIICRREDTPFIVETDSTTGSELRNVCPARSQYIREVKLDRAFAGTLASNTLTVDNEATTGALTSTDITSDSLTTGTINATGKSALEDVELNSLKFKGFITLEKLPKPVDWRYISIKHFKGGTIYFRLNDRLSIKIERTSAKNGERRNTVATYSVDYLTDLLEVAEDRNGVYLKTQCEGTLDYGYVGVEEQPALEVETVNTVPYTAEATIFPVTKRSHVVILGDGSPNSGLTVKGELDADLIPEPGTTSFTDLDVTGNLTVGGTAAFQDFAVAGVFKADDLEANRTSKAADFIASNSVTTADLFSTGNISAENETVNGTLTANNIYGNGEFSEANGLISAAVKLRDSSTSDFYHKGVPVKSFFLDDFATDHPYTNLDGLEPVMVWREPGSHGSITSLQMYKGKIRRVEPHYLDGPSPGTVNIDNLTGESYWGKSYSGQVQFFDYKNSTFPPKLQNSGGKYTNNVRVSMERGYGYENNYATIQKCSFEMDSKTYGDYVRIYYPTGGSEAGWSEWRPLRTYEDDSVLSGLQSVNKAEAVGYITTQAEFDDWVNKHDFSDCSKIYLVSNSEGVYVYNKTTGIDLYDLYVTQLEGVGHPTIRFTEALTTPALYYSFSAIYKRGVKGIDFQIDKLQPLENDGYFSGLEYVKDSRLDVNAIATPTSGPAASLSVFAGCGHVKNVDVMINSTHKNQVVYGFKDCHDVSTCRVYGDNGTEGGGVAFSWGSSNIRNCTANDSSFGSGTNITNCQAIVSMQSNATGYPVFLRSSVIHNCFIRASKTWPTTITVKAFQDCYGIKDCVVQQANSLDTFERAYASLDESRPVGDYENGGWTKLYTDEHFKVEWL